MLEKDRFNLWKVFLIAFVKIGGFYKGLLKHPLTYKPNLNPLAKIKKNYHSFVKKTVNIFCLDRKPSLEAFLLRY